MAWILCSLSLSLSEAKKLLELSCEAQTGAAHLTLALHRSTHSPYAASLRAVVAPPLAHVPQVSAHCTEP